MHVLIVDDEPLARQRLFRMVSQMEGCECVGEADDGEGAISAINKLDPDVVLLDVCMPGEDGLATAKSIAELADPPAVIFCTAYDEYALKAFDTLAVGYLLKPVQAEQLSSAMEKATKLNKVQRSSLNGEKHVAQQKKRNNISAKSRKGLELIPLDTVHCFIADQKYVTVIHQGGETLIDDTLKELEDEFAGSFIRVHRNSLVSIADIAGMTRLPEGQYEIKLKTSDYRPLVSRRHLATVREILTQL